MKVVLVIFVLSLISCKKSNVQPSKPHLEVVSQSNDTTYYSFK